jgi:hypothetical protein
VTSPCANRAFGFSAPPGRTRGLSAETPRAVKATRLSAWIVTHWARRAHGRVAVLPILGMFRLAIALLFAASFYFAGLARAHACSCVESAGVSDDRTAAGSVFEGKVIDLRHEPKHHRLTARVHVLRRWKGTAQANVDVVTSDQGSLCGFGFARGKSYLLFTPEAEGTLSVSLCSRSKPSEAADADFAELDRLAALDQPAPALPAASASPEPASPATAAPPSQPGSAAPAAAPQPATAAAEPGRGGCAGCSATGSTGPLGFSTALALTLAACVRRWRRMALNAPGSSGNRPYDERERRKAPDDGDPCSGSP